MAQYTTYTVSFHSSPLYILYAQASAYAEAYASKAGFLISIFSNCVVIACGVKISIHGDEEEARGFTGEWLNNGGGRQSEDDSDSDMDTKTESSSRRVLTTVF